MKRWGVLAVLVVLLLPAAAGALPVQYQAAMVKVFLSNYQAFPLFRTNPVFPGDVLELNETRLLSYKTCYAGLPQKPGNYARIPDFAKGMAIAADGSVLVAGQALDKRILDAEAGGKLALSRTVSLTLAPLSVEGFEPDAAALARWDRDKPECASIGELLAGKGGRFLVAEVMHGMVNFAMEGRATATLDAEAEGALLERIAKAFPVKKADISVAGSTARFSVAASPDPHTLAIVPARLSHAELARITNYLRGKRGADLEIAVLEALRAEDMGTFESVLVRIDALLSDDTAAKERWAQRFVAGDDMRDIAAIRDDRELNFRDIANYAAARMLQRGREMKIAR